MKEVNFLFLAAFRKSRLCNSSFVLLVYVQQYQAGSVLCFFGGKASRFELCLRFCLLPFKEEADLAPQRNWLALNRLANVRRIRVTTELTDCTAARQMHTMTFLVFSHLGLVFRADADTGRPPPETLLVVYPDGIRLLLDHPGGRYLLYY